MLFTPSCQFIYTHIRPKVDESIYLLLIEAPQLVSNKLKKTKNERRSFQCNIYTHRNTPEI